MAYSLFAHPAFPEAELSTYQLSSSVAPPDSRKLNMQIEISTSTPTHILTPLLWFCSIGSTLQLLALISKPDSLSPSRPSNRQLFRRNYSLIRDAPLELRSLSLFLNKLNRGEASNAAHKAPNVQLRKQNLSWWICKFKIL